MTADAGSLYRGPFGSPTQSKREQHAVNKTDTELR
jgi:hypothetical protein